MGRFLLSLTLSLLVSHVLSHGWLVTPTPRGFTGDNQNSASTNSPCGLTDPTYVAPLVVQGNGSVSVKWTNGGGHDTGAGPQTCRFAWANTDTSAATFDSQVLYTKAGCVAGAGSATVGLLNVPSGTTYLQFLWSAGDGTKWYGCTKLFITDSSLSVNELPVGEEKTATLTKDTNIHYSVTGLPVNDPTGAASLMDKYYMLLNVTVPSTTTGTSGNVSASSQLIPLTANDAPNYTIYPGSSTFTTVCDIGDGLAYATIFSGDLEGQATIKATIYEAHLDYVNNPKLALTLQKGAAYKFWTQASSTFNVPKRVVIQGRGGLSYLSGPFKTCDVTNYIKPDTPTPCVDVASNIQNNVKTQYFLAEVDSEFIGNVRIEDGTCADYSGVSQILASLLLLTIALLF